MPLSESERRRLTQIHMKRHFPGASPENVKTVVTLSCQHFVGDYSPIKEEQDHKSAGGSGVSFEDFVIYMGRHVTKQEPDSVDSGRLDRIIRGVISISHIFDKFFCSNFSSSPEIIPASV